jgi:hypothetical protein
LTNYEQPAMTALEFKTARLKLGLSLIQFAGVLGVSESHVKRMEASPDSNMWRPVRPVTANLVRAMLGGFRPPNWPAEGRANTPGKPVTVERAKSRAAPKIKPRVRR